MSITQFFWIATCLVAGIWFFFFQFASTPPTGPVDLAVVFGNKVEPSGRASRLLEDRVMAAVDLYHQGMVKTIMLSGGMEPPAAPGLPERNEAVAMRQVCLDHGIPESALILDPLGINTRASVINAQAIMRQRHLTTVVGISDDSHLPRIKMTFASVGIEANTVACHHDLWLMADPMWVMREIAGTVVYKFNPHYRETEVARMAVEKPRIVVHKSARTLTLYDGDRMVKQYACITGRAAGDKQKEGDLKTPIGTFKICYKNPESKFHLSMGLDYPNISNAEEGLKAGLITQEEHDQIVQAIHAGGTPNWYTKLGGEIFIHGHAEGRDSTLGCIAVTNPDVEELYAICDTGTVVEVLP